MTYAEDDAKEYSTNYLEYNFGSINGKSGGAVRHAQAKPLGISYARHAQAKPLGISYSRHALEPEK